MLHVDHCLANAQLNFHCSWEEILISIDAPSRERCFPYPFAALFIVIVSHQNAEYEERTYLRTLAECSHRLVSTTGLCLQWPLASLVVVPP